MHTFLLTVSYLATAAFWFYAGVKLGQRAMQRRIIRATLEAQLEKLQSAPEIPDITVPKDGKFILNGQEYEVMEDDNFVADDSELYDEDYEVIELPEYDAFGVPVYDKKDKKPN